DAARIFLADALEHALGPAALDAYGDAGKRGLEGFRDLLGQRQVDRSIVVDLSFLLRGLDQRRRDRRRFPRRAARGGGKQAGGGGSRRLEHVAPGESTLGHCFLLLRSGHLGVVISASLRGTGAVAERREVPLSSWVIAQSRGQTRDDERYTPNSLL